ncbi:MAG: alpha/beta hydrolase [Ruminococcaceae bacterium]|nr:alpha/beta hydrolase [Oscillospiraceae bacterium]
MSEIFFEEFTYLSSDGVTTVHAYIWAPREPRAIIQLSHGMCEYVERYDEWARRFAAASIVFCGNDHLGHGRTAKEKNDLGYTAPRGGAELLVDDLYKMSLLMREKYPHLPLFLYGHSMGSFAARLYLSKYGHLLSGALISGTAGSGAPTGLALKLTHAIARLKGTRHRSAFITSLAFGAYNKRFQGENDLHSWLTRDKAVRDRYEKDPFCHFVFTTAGYDTLFSLLGAVGKKTWAASVPKNLPILLFAGDMDPVGSYGKGVAEVHGRLLAAGCNSTLRLYENGRHEMHNETNKDEVFGDLIDFLSRIPMPIINKEQDNEL